MDRQLVRRASRIARVGLCIAIAIASRQARAEDPASVQWNEDWARVRPVEVASAFGLVLGTWAINRYVTPPHRPHVSGGFLFDSWVRSALRGRSYSAQRTASDLGDYLYKGGVLAPFVVDFYVVALGVHQNADVALQMLLINLQSYGAAGVMTLTAEYTVGRARPYTQDCGRDRSIRDASGARLFNHCEGGGDDYQSFYSGHATATATAAGLTCVHHQHLPLYGGGVADLVPCVLMIGVSAGTGISRIVADQHWASDVLLGWGVGAFWGYVLPSLLHYGWGGGKPIGELHLGDAHAVPIVQTYGLGMGIGLVGVLP